MSVLYCAGQYANLLERANAVTLSPAVDALFPASSLYDGRVSLATRHGSNGANPTITADLASFAPGGAATRTIVVRSGERRRIDLTGGPANVSIQNLTTGKFLTAAAAWQAGSTNCLAATGSLDYQVESLTLCQAETVTLQIISSGGTLSEWPRWNAMGIVGHNLVAGLTVELRSSTDNFAGSNVLEATGSIRQPGFLMRAPATVQNRYVRLAITGTNTSAPWYCEVAPVFLETASFGLGMDHDLSHEWAAIENGTSFGEARVYTLSPQPRRVLKLSFKVGSTAAETELRQEIVMRCQGKAYPILIAPLSTIDPTLVLLGRLDKSWEAIRNFDAIWSTDIVISEGYVVTPLA